MEMEPQLKVEIEDKCEAQYQPGSLKYRRSITLGCKDNGIRKSKFGAKTH